MHEQNITDIISYPLTRVLENFPICTSSIDDQAGIKKNNQKCHLQIFF